MAEQHLVPSEPALRAITALADILREVGGELLCVDVKSDGTAWVRVHRGRQRIADAVLATTESGSVVWEMISGGSDG